MESNFQLKSSIGSAHTLLKQNNYYYYFKKGLLLLFELLSYVLFFVLMIGIFSIPNNPIAYDESLNHDTTLHTVVESKKLFNIMVGLKAILFLIPLSFLAVGLFLGYIRRKNNRIRQAVLYLEEAMKMMH
ncbi:hypothetical protein H9X57_07530 [Flavobacterium piscinae]|uniref:Uncharacterized protein n=1 Tax=Flavobacterium piscinae TaxID=2506424 RepID=A0A4Q1KPJ0_9FLAO|nr:hypothetical protein [Flavobacterium piscinae]MBC8883331.1 hypothetical protein [Flavobacterium piscinae]RXR31495.1 hypothetical protein EQG68_09545 [Flavobacterium piscinae]